MLHVPPQEDVYEIEVLEGELVSDPHVQLEPAGTERLPQRTAQPSVQTAVAMATGFVAGAAAMALLRRYGQARLEHLTPAERLEPQRRGQVRTFVVQVRQIG